MIQLDSTPKLLESMMSIVDAGLRAVDILVQI